jgi:hypothetical protein
MLATLPLEGNLCYVCAMKTVTGRVVGNTVVLDEPLPEGAVVEVSVHDLSVHSPASTYGSAARHDSSMSEADQIELLRRMEKAKTVRGTPSEIVFERLRQKRIS